MSKGSNTLNQQAAKPSRSVLFGAAFLMATSAIGPGFLTQTSKFTAQFGTALSLVIVLAIIMDITAQMNIWSVVSVSGMRAQDVANKLLPGLGVVIAILVAIGGLAFNVGNVGGVALGFNAMFGLNEKIGAVIAGCLGIIIFVNKNAKTIMDKVATVLAAVILLTVATVAVISKPPVGEAVSSLAQLGNLGNKDLLLALTTLLGGSCGGYIAFSGAHRLLDAGNPAAEAFRLAAGNIGYRLFGLCLFSAGVSSVVGAAYTSVSFLKTLHPFIAKYERQFVIGFITFSTVMMVVLGNAAALLIIAGAFNGLILPVTLGVMLIAGHNKRIVGESYHHPLWMTVLGAVVTLVALYAGIKAVPGIMQLFQ